MRDSGGHNIPRNHWGLGRGILSLSPDRPIIRAILVLLPFLRSIILWIGYGNSTVNPFIYGFFCREFRAVILSDLRKVRVVMESRNDMNATGV